MNNEHQSSAGMVMKWPNVQSYWGFTDETLPAHHLARPDIPHKPSDVPNRTPREVACRSLPCPVQDPGERHKSHREIGRSNCE